MRELTTEELIARMRDDDARHEREHLHDITLARKGW